MSFIQQFFTSRDNNANAETFVGQEGRLWWDPVSNQIYSSDGNTPGGIPLSGGGGNGSPGGANSQVQFNQNGTFGGSANLTFDRTSGAITAVSFAGDGSTLSNIAGANITGTVANATYATTAGSATTAATVTTNAQPNITSVGNLDSLSVTGNVAADYFIGNGSQLTGISAGSGNSISNGSSSVSIPVADGNVDIATSNGAYHWNFDTAGNLALPATGSVNFNGGSITQTLNEDLVIRVNDDESDGWSIYNVVSDGAGNDLTQTRLEYNAFNIRTDIQGASHTWSFNDSGTLNLPGDVAGNVGGNLAIKIVDQPGSDTFIDLQTRSYVGDALISNIRIANPNVTVSTSSGAYNWAFNGDGTTAFPGNVINSNANPITLWSTNSSSLLWRSPTGGGPGSPVQTTVSADNGNATISVSTGTLFVRNIETWTFDTAGNTTFPDATVQTTAYPGTATSFSVTGNITGGNILSNGQLSTAGNITGGNLTVGGTMTAVGNIAASWVQAAYYTGTWATNFVSTGNVSGTNLLTTGLISATGNITGGNILGGANVNATTHTGTTVSVTGNITGGNVIATTTVYGNAATAFVAGPAAISGVALQMPQEGALRNLNNGLTNMYFDVSIGGSTNGQFQFRSSSSFTNVLTMSPTAFNVNPEAVVTAKTASLGRTAWNSAIDTELTIDDYRWRITNSGGIYPQVISNTGGTKNSAWTAVAAISGQAVAQGGSTGVLVANNAWTTLYTFASMNSAGDTVTVTFQDKNLGRIYRITFMRSDNGSTTGYNIIAERLL